MAVGQKLDAGAFQSGQIAAGHVPVDFPGSLQALLMVAVGIIDGVILRQAAHQLQSRLKGFLRVRCQQVSRYENQVRLRLPDGLQKSFVLFSVLFVVQIRQKDCAARFLDPSVRDGMGSDHESVAVIEHDP